MDWTKFNTHGQSFNDAFEVMCNILFEGWCKSEYKDTLKYFSFVNGKGGDGGVEAYGVLASGEVIGVQSKWFPNKMDDSQFNQIKNSFKTAVKVRPKITRYIVCIPRDLSSKRVVKNNEIAKTTEESKWLDLVENFKETNPSVSVELWDETTIQAKLMTQETLGCYKYWFENTNVFEAEIENSFERAINGWAKTKYIPDLYSTDYIHDKLEIFIGNYSVVKRRYNGTQKILSIFDSLKKAYMDILKLEFSEQEKPIAEKIKLDIDVLNKWISQFKSIEEIVVDGAEVEKKFIDDRFELNCSVSELKNCSLSFRYYSHFAPAIEVLGNNENEEYETSQELNSE